ncbi:FAD-dependent monooxygenase cctM [Fulvia fulva]|uniref:FAD-dependent monooxygenase cctM n=1 Tax=Passalora fulva TaxID=5499 RepID=A0A9Q8PG33_PASFU|nr:FAD-dependent monooxygenase cctM [Fulvia fulva]KAK4614213.1 FAD-dependent monooxygenase cctM [Fulvia fulva]KAK4615206.1 FAD-dependent monooxygenase cctM [Fulvia fulva]UJO21843.1 FAD-dependent monooxygenase cctM [Fulvia fulva]WPV20540.1 FAD-dependent monooxygenase cctM [Fulvia fulva]WPV35618.1 FAD-dependent monooxygenase cctM [Fulvia fulva]
MTQVDPHIPQIKENQSVPMFEGSSGKLIKVLESSKCYRLRRDKLRELLSRGLDVRYGKELAKIELTGGYRTVAARFTDGSQNTGRLLIGCDGAHSLVRSNLVGGLSAQLKPLGFATAMCYSKHTAEHAKWLRSPPFHPINQFAVHPDGKAAWLSVHDAENKDDPSSWTFFHYISYPTPPDHDKWNTAKLLQHQKELAKSFCEPWRSIYQWMPDDATEVWNTSLQDWDPSLPEHGWDSQHGRVTLAGDAAHPMTFQRGQGANNALQDALELCRAAETCWQSVDFTKGGGIEPLLCMSRR